MCVRACAHIEVNFLGHVRAFGIDFDSLNEATFVRRNGIYYGRGYFTFAIHRACTRYTFL